MCRTSHDFDPRLAHFDASVDDVDGGRALLCARRNATERVVNNRIEMRKGVNDISERLGTRCVVVDKTLYSVIRLRHRDARVKMKREKGKMKKKMKNEK